MPIAAIITVSDSRSAGAAEDRGGPVAAEVLAGLGFEVVRRSIVPDELSAIREAVTAAVKDCELVVLTGGTGVSNRDVTPEAVEPLFDRTLPGFGEIMRTATFSKTPLSIISRGGAGVVGRSLVILLPGSPKGVKDCLEVIGPAARHVVKVLCEGPMDCQGLLDASKNS